MEVSRPPVMKVASCSKPFQCSECDKQFRQLSTLTNHMKIHTGNCENIQALVHDQ